MFHAEAGPIVRAVVGKHILLKTGASVIRPDEDRVSRIVDATVGASAADRLRTEAV